MALRDVVLGCLMHLITVRHQAAYHGFQDDDDVYRRCDERRSGGVDIMFGNQPLKCRDFWHYLFNRQTGIEHDHRRDILTLLDSIGAAKGTHSETPR